MGVNMKDEKLVKMFNPTLKRRKTILFFLIVVINGLTWIVLEIGLDTCTKGRYQKFGISILYTWACWNLHSLQIFAISFFILVPLSAPSGLCNLLCNGRDLYGNGSISSCHEHWVTSVVTLATWGSAHL